VLNATTTNGGTISYMFRGLSEPAPTVCKHGIQRQAHAATVLPPGQYLITATNSADMSTAMINFTVLQQHEWIINAAGNLTGLDAAGNPYVSNVMGGGLGIAIDNGGTIWTANTAGTSLATFSNFGSALPDRAERRRAERAGGARGRRRGFGLGRQRQQQRQPVHQPGHAALAEWRLHWRRLELADGIAVDQAGNVWVSNGGNNSITEIVGAARRWRRSRSGNEQHRRSQAMMTRSRKPHLTTVSRNSFQRGAGS
jgi:streptogramin lyase